MTAQTWTSLQTTLLAALVKSQPPYTVVPADFATLYPQATSYAEGRIYKDIVLLATRTEDSTSLATSSGVRSLALAGMTPNVVIVQEGFGLITPAAATTATGTIQWFARTSLDFIDRYWPRQSTTASPNSVGEWERFWAPLDNNTIVFAPTPDAAYNAVIPGLYQPTPISAGNPTSYLLSVYPELFEAACLVFLTGALTHSFGQQSDDPRSAMSWENTYRELMTLARDEEMRRRGLATNVARQPTAQPQPA